MRLLISGMAAFQLLRRTYINENFQAQLKIDSVKEAGADGQILLIPFSLRRADGIWIDDSGTWPRLGQLVWIERMQLHNGINCHTCLPFWWRHLTRSLNLIFAGEFKRALFFWPRRRWALLGWQHLSECCGFTKQMFQALVSGGQ